MATLAPSLEQLRTEVDARWPGRDTGSDGWIGDPAHQDRPSDHNPGDRGLVHALDIDEDVDGTDDEAGAELLAVADWIRLRHDPRVKYLIYEARMFSSYDHAEGPAWTWRPYRGVNLHRRHLHVSVLSTVAAEQDRRPWLPPIKGGTMALDEADVGKVRTAMLEVLDGRARRVRGIRDFEHYMEVMLDTQRATLAAAQLAAARAADDIAGDVDEAELARLLVGQLGDDLAEAVAAELGERLSRPPAGPTVA